MTERPSRMDAELARALLEVESRERRRMAEVLHDDLLQLLAAARLALATQNGEERAGGLLESAIRRGRQICRGMEPTPLVGGLDETLPRVLDAVFESHRLQTTLDLRAAPRLSPIIHDILLSCAAELLVNVARHAEGSSARITIDTSSHWVSMRVDDDGPGFQPSVSPTAAHQLGGMGFPALERRVRALSGGLDWWNRQPRGASVMVCLPLEG
jgi:signal transduction histidine kinase